MPQGRASGAGRGVGPWLARVLDVDPRAFAALLRVGIQLDLRSGQATTDGSRRGRGGARAVRLLIAYALAGGWVGFFIAGESDFFAPVLFHQGALTLMIGALVVLEFNSIVLSPDDLVAVAHQPVASQTVFFARLAHALVYTQALGLAFSAIPLGVIAAGIQGAAPGIALLALLASSGTIVGVTLASVFLYAGILRFVSHRYVRLVLTVSQLGLSLLVYSTFLFVRRRPDLGALVGGSFAESPALLLFPPGWFASWIDLATRGVSPEALLAALLSVAAVPAGMLLAKRSLAARYTEGLLTLRPDAEDGRVARARRSGGWLFRAGESRAMGILIPRQFRYDYRFRLGVLGVLPLTLLYLIIGLDQGPLPDPFVIPELTQGPALLYLAVLISPALLVPSFVYSDVFPASWLYHVTPARGSHLLLAVRNYIAVCFIGPYLACITATFAYHYGSLLHAIAHAGVLGLCSGLFLLLALLFNPGLPFGSPVQRGRFSLRTLVPFGLAPLFTFGAMPVLMQQGYRSGGSLALVVAGLLAANVLWGRWVARRIAARATLALPLG